MIFGQELSVGFFDDAMALDVDEVERVDHHFADSRIGEEPFDRAEADHVVHDLSRESLALGY